MKNKVLAALLAAALVISIVPTVFADSTQTVGAGSTTTESAASVASLSGEIPQDGNLPTATQASSGAESAAVETMSKPNAEVQSNGLDTVTSESANTADSEPALLTSAIPFQIKSIEVSGLKVTVSVSDESVLAKDAFSFNGGWTWQSSNTYQADANGFTFGVSGIQVKTSAGQIVYNTQPVVVDADKKAPEFEIVSNGATVTVTATDEGVGLAAQAYSFNGGWTWQDSNTYTVKAAYSWPVGTIVIRDAAGNMDYNRTIITAAPVVDNTPPDISSIVVEERKVTVTATDTGSGLAATAYSFNGGWTWQTANTYSVDTAYSWPIGTIVVRDAAGNVNYNRQIVSAAPVRDVTPPEISSITVKGMTVTVTAKDAVGLHATAYSFNGGWTWQSANTYTVDTSYTWVPGTIQVRDLSGNVNYNRNAITAKDDLPPTMTIAINGLKVSVVAVDDTGLAAQAYSFNGGWTWQSDSSYTVDKAKSWPAGTILVRDRAGNIAYNTKSIIVGDVKAPVINNIYFTPQTDAPRKTLYVSVSEETGLAAQAYSFNGGWTWQADSFLDVSQTKTWPVGTILVRDAAGNISYNSQPVTVTISADVKAPEISFSISGGGRYTTSKTLTITAKDDGYLADQAYSFNGGWTWQKEPYQNFTKPTTFPAGTLLARDKAGNISYNTVPVHVGMMIQIVQSGMSAAITVLEDIDGGCGYPPKTFSFNGGTTWQSSATYTLTSSYTWKTGTILAKDDLGNVNYNGEDVVVTVSDNKVIDVSAYQGAIDWAKVRASGVNYAIIRAVTWSKTAGGYVEDPLFDYNVRSAKAQGIKVGAYIFCYAVTQSESQAEVNVFLNAASRLKAQGYTLDLPVFVDYEYSALLTKLTTVGARTDLLRYEMALLSQNGYYSAMYMNTNWATNYVNAAQLQNEGYDLWLADHRGYNGYGNNVALWQYTSKSSITGISGNVDVSVLYKDYSSIIKGSSNTGSATATALFTVFDSASGKNVTDTMNNLLAAIVNNEVGGTALTGQDAAKLYKAQAIAAHSKLLYSYAHQELIPTVRLNYGGRYSTIRDNISDVVNTIVTYNNEAANAAYTSATNGTTNSADAYWGASLPYLTPVNSAYESVYASAYLNKTTTISREALCKELTSIVGGDYSSSYSYGDWIRINSRNTNGYVTGLTVWGRTVNVSTFCEKVSAVNSPDFTVTATGDYWTFKTSGNGSCVGMSQYGAMGYIAKAGWDYTDVLSHYYPGTVLQRIA